MTNAYAAIAEALTLLENPANIAHARAVLQGALAGQGLTTEQQHDLATDPTVEAALTRIQAGGQRYYRAAPGGGPSSVLAVHTSPLRPARDEDLDTLGY